VQENCVSQPTYTLKSALKVTKGDYTKPRAFFGESLECIWDSFYRRPNTIPIAVNKNDFYWLHWKLTQISKQAAI